ncbi:unnamed protein product, partial [Cladocopium goreaui]
MSACRWTDVGTVVWLSSALELYKSLGWEAFLHPKMHTGVPLRPDIETDEKSNFLQDAVRRSSSMMEAAMDAMHGSDPQEGQRLLSEVLAMGSEPSLQRRLDLALGFEFPESTRDGDFVSPHDPGLFGSAVLSAVLSRGTPLTQRRAAPNRDVAMLSSKQIGGSDLTEAVKPGSAVRWVLANDGTVAWPTGTTLRLVSGPMVAAPILEVPSASPGLTVEMELELVSDKDDVEVAYALVTPGGQPFGDLLQFRVEKTEVESPICVILKAPETCVEGLQGEVKMMRWTLANISKVSWPKDACCQLFYNTPGFANLPCSIEMPEEVPAGMTVEVEVPVLLPEKEGQFKAMWAVTSPSLSDFGE